MRSIIGARPSVTNRPIRCTIQIETMTDADTFVQMFVISLKTMITPGLH